MDDILARSSHVEGCKDVNDPDRHGHLQYEAGVRGGEAGNEAETQGQYEVYTAGKLVQEIPPPERREVGKKEEECQEVSASAKSTKTSPVLAEE